MKKEFQSKGGRGGFTKGEEEKALGIIAGGGQFPLLVAEAAKRRGLRVVAVAHEGETDPALAELVESISWVKLGKLGRLIKVLKHWSIKEVILAGSITKMRMFEGVRPDLRALSVMTKLAIFHDDDILRALANELKKEGINVIDSTKYLPEIMAPQGCLTKRRPTKGEKEDIEFGWKIAKELGRLDIGQCVVVRRKTVLALEAIEGTDETILRGGRLAKEKAVVVKVSKPGQDLRFDLPTVGLNTVKTMARVGATVLAVEAGKTLIFDRDKMVEYAQQHGITIYCKR